MDVIQRTPQLEKWTGEFGRSYTARNQMSAEESDEKHYEQVGMSLSAIHRALLGDLEVTRILEVGCNIGNQLALIQRIGNYNLYGIEPQAGAIRSAHERLRRIHFTQATGLELPFQDGAFDLIYTCGVLIHIAPDDLRRVMSEIYRCAKRYIMGYEYYAPNVQQVRYRDEAELLWKMDYAEKYVELFPTARKVRQVMTEFKAEVYGTTGLVNQGFVLEK